MQKRVLVVDDVDLILMMAKRAFSKADYQISVAQNIDEARRLIRCEKFDAVLSDVHFPGGGYRAVQQELANLLEPPLLYLMSGMPLDFYAEGVAVEQFFLKPFDTKSIVAKIASDIDFLKIKHYKQA